MNIFPVLSPYAGFWQRCVALLIDMTLFGLVVVPLYFLGSGLLAIVAGSPILLWLLIGSFVTFPLWLYYALFESGRWQATPGKKLLGLKVTDTGGAQIDFGQASVRFFAKILSHLIWNIGFLMVAFTRRKQGLHDLIARTLVIESR